MFILVGLEIRTLYLDRDEHDREQVFAACQQLESFTRIATILGNAILSSQNQFSITMKQFTLDEKASQNRFSATMKAFSKTERANQTRFDRSFAHEEQLAEGQTGVLKPGNDPTPLNSCSVPPGATMVVFGGGNVSWFSKTPHTLVLSQKHGPVISVQKLSKDLITLKFDLRSSDGNVCKNEPRLADVLIP